MTPRKPLGDITPKKAPYKELKSYDRAKIVTLFHTGWTYRKISEKLQIPYSTVRNTCQKDPHRTNHASLPRSGRPEKTSSYEQRLIRRAIQKDPFITYRDLRAQNNLTVSDDTILRILKKSGYGHLRAQRRPKLRDIDAQKATTLPGSESSWTRVGQVERGHIQTWSGYRVLYRNQVRTEWCLLWANWACVGGVIAGILFTVDRLHATACGGGY